MRYTRFLAAALLLLVLPACIFSPKKDEDEGQKTTPLTPNDTPENAIKRFMQVYAQRNAVEYERMFTGDFAFEFSNAADPELVQEFSNGWFKEDEKVSSTNLFQGGVNQDGAFVAGATSIEVSLTNTLPSDDPNPERDPLYYKVLFTPVTVRITVPAVPEEITYVIGEGTTPQSNRFFLVRGDYAVGLSPEQPADSVHWYIWNWRDESPDIDAKGTGPYDLASQQQVSSERHVSWGELKALVR